MPVSDAEHDNLRRANAALEVRVAILEANQVGRDRRLDAIESTLERLREMVGGLQLRVGIMAAAAAAGGGAIVPLLQAIAGGG